MSSILRGVTICMLGGDLRELELAKALLSLECQVRLVGFLPHSALKAARFCSNPLEAITGAKAILAPMSNTDVSGRIQSRIDQGMAIDLLEVMEHLKASTPIFLGVAKPVIRQAAKKYQLRLIETAEIDEIAIYNSIPTAEGAIQVAMEQTKITIHGSSALVLGFGRCGMTLSRALKGLGARVRVAARSKEDRARAYAFGLESVSMEQFPALTEFDFIFNTIPALVITRAYLMNLSRNALIVDIAVAPGGTDFAAAKEFGIHAISALSLPGKVAPVTAGKILTRCLPKVLEEVLGGSSHES